ncbi:similar to Saccharomyces cerevisiae YJR106W ECM27 Putative protein of unknown function [Maudiozyma barnettii]|uniref:Sodium/calcium exchanger membrane region domain-containing protein n=1 Tax=Maudiozyma barnettii TaxID=61262 RepID=A0A8H2ZJ44_9SACH|nr:Ecm27p [Kazachstania barnettii]CAB4255618.1 similar to Saccharomyces cerevisiae YJR106W ECM27 Putative protein of unknown function [Kazachstania barnettii]CAD1784179.1 similar to Saccharomyces cerevisiae YJR106W ECM27 Putative protein of unknown function [Kazachstania barnettii]
MSRIEWLFKLAHPATLYTNAHLSLSFISPSVVHVVVCFVLLGICASDYLCPNVAAIADSSYSDQYVTRNQVRNTGALMAVLLSWCNSSPDLFSNLVSWTTSSSPAAAALSIGEVLGACGIILCVVEGSIFIIMSSTTISITNSQRNSILKDLSFTAVAMLIMTYVAIQNKITVFNCMLMMSVYAIYIVIKLTPHKYQDKIIAAINSNTGVATQDTIPSVQNDTNVDVANEFLDQEALLADDDLQSFSSTHIRPGIKPSLISVMDYNSLLGMLENSSSVHNEASHEQAEMVSMQGNSFILPSQGSNNSSNKRPVSEPPAHLSIPTIEISDTGSLNTSPIDFHPYSDNPDSELESEVHSVTLNNTNITKLLLRSKKYRNLTLKLLAPHLINYKSKSKVDRILSILAIPFVLVLQIACPKNLEIMEYDDINSKYTLIRSHIIVFLIQAICSPAIGFIVVSCLSNFEFANFFWLFPVSITICIITLIIVFYQYVKLHNKFSLFEQTSVEAEEKTRRRRELERLHDSIQLIFISIGIINAILFISMIANSLIEMMELYQIITGISKAILGLTIFAWGNSISDLISNIAMCKFYLKVPHQDDLEHIQAVATKFFVISCTSCLGGVMLNSMCGIGLSAFIAMVFVHDHSGQWWFFLSRNLEDAGSEKHYNAKFVVPCLFIILQVIFLLTIFGGPRYITQWTNQHRRTVGLTMCGIWGVATLFNVFIEIFS